MGRFAKLPKQGRNANFSVNEKEQFARYLRDNPPPAEKMVWDRLRKHQLGFRFRRQVLILGWIVDFYCPELGLVVEIDGWTHDPAKDAFRDAKMRELGLSILRIRNREVYKGLNFAIYRIQERVNTLKRRGTR